MKQDILIVTDHSTHSSSNSLYELSVAMHADARSNHIWVCSRSFQENDAFFSSKPGAKIFASPVSEDFEFDPSGKYLRQTGRVLDRDDIDNILIRMPQPLDKTFLRSLLSIAPAHRIINHPEGTIETSSKEFLLNIAHLCPSPVMIHSIEEAIQLSHQHEIVLKPLYSYGGRGIVRLSPQFFWRGMDRRPAKDIYSVMTDVQFPMLAMRYLPNVSFGDKRTIVVNKQIIGSALRIPPVDSWICNVAQGGQAEIADADAEELRIEHEITPLLYDKGVVMYGFDTLVDDDGKRVLSEINTLSIGGLGPMEEMSGKPLLKKAATLLWDYLEE